VSRAVRGLPCPALVLALLLALVLLLAGCTGGAARPEGRPPPAASSTSTAGPSGGPSAGPSGVPADRARLAAFFGGEVRLREEGSFGLDRGALVPTGAATPAGEALRVAYPRGSASPASNREYGSPNGGMQVYLPFTAGPTDDAYLRYWVRYPAGFIFVKGGKLPGLWGGTEVSGGDVPDGTDGFSTRLMWRTGGAGEVYLYADQQSGVSLGRGSWTWPTGRWVCVEEHVRLGDPSRADGSVTVWLDGEQVFTRPDLRYRTVPDLRIEGIFFSTFYGGSDPSWGPPSDQYVDFAGFAVAHQRPGCSG
jgi:hypothetical protein